MRTGTVGAGEFWQDLQGSVGRATNFDPWVLLVLSFVTQWHNRHADTYLVFLSYLQTNFSRTYNRI